MLGMFPPCMLNIITGEKILDKVSTNPVNYSLDDMTNKEDKRWEWQGIHRVKMIYRSVPLATIDSCSDSGFYITAGSLR